MRYRPSFIGLFLLLCSGGIFAQTYENMTTHQQRGVPGTGSKEQRDVRPSSDLAKSTSFKNAAFDSPASFTGATFDGTADFFGAAFKSTAMFTADTFKSAANFLRAGFDGTADFSDATFKGAAYFFYSTFKDTADFFRATFDSGVHFTEAIFDRTANFFLATFDSTADFFLARFDSTAVFSDATFRKTANFHRTRFDGRADFTGARFAGVVFREAESKEYLAFERARVSGVMVLGSHENFMIDLTLANLSEAIVEFSGAAQVKMLLQNFDRIRLVDTLGYMGKQFIIDHLKEKSFPGDKAAAFELDYILARSTMYQAATFNYESAAWYTCVWNWFYDATMGFGYRPFRIIWWALAIIVSGTMLYFLSMRNRINEYVAQSFKREGRGNSFTGFETLVNCAYFSVMLFFTFRFKGNLLTFFNAKEKKVIIIEWLLGLAVYGAFLYHTSSVLQNIRSLFVGG